MHFSKVATFAAVIAPLLGGPAQSQTWEGAYAGLQIARTGQATNGFATPAPLVTYSSAQTTSETLAIFAGYTWAIAGPLQLGIEGDALLGTVSGQGRPTVGAQQFTHDYTNTLSLRGRVGFDAGAVMPFFAFGVTSTELTHGFVNGGVAAPSAEARISGATLGAGADFAVGHKGFLRVELRHMAFANESFPARTGVVPVTATGLDLTQARIGYALRF